MYGIFTYICHKKSAKCRYICHTWILWVRKGWERVGSKQSKPNCPFFNESRVRVWVLELARQIPHEQWAVHPCWLGYMGVSKNNGTPKSSILIGFSIISHPFWGTPIFGNIHIGDWDTTPIILGLFHKWWHKDPYKDHLSESTEITMVIVVVPYLGLWDPFPKWPI